MKEIKRAYPTIYELRQIQWNRRHNRMYRTMAVYLALLIGAIYTWTKF